MMPADRYGMDPEQMRRVIVSIGKPAPARFVMPALPRRTVLLLILLATVMLLGLAGLAGAQGEQEPVQKGSARAQGIQISPLEKLEFDAPAAPPSLYNFLQIISPLRVAAAPPSPGLILRAYEPDDRREPDLFGKPEEPTIAVAFLALFCLVVLWLHLRDKRHAQQALAAKKKGRTR